MAEPSPLRHLTTVLRTGVSLPITIPRYLSTEPLLTGPLLYVLTRGPPSLRERLLAPIRQRGLLTEARLKTVINLLRVFLALGVVDRANKTLNAWAMNGWYLPGRKPMAKWRWDGSSEVVVITGGSSGFGYEMVKGFAGKAKVVVIDVMDLPKELEALHNVHFYRCDLADFDAIHSTCSAIKNAHGNPTVLINNAGIGGDDNMTRHSHTNSDENTLIGTGKTILDTSTEFIKKIMAVNLTSHFVLIREFLPGMLDAKKGHIVGIASMASFVAAPGLVDYCVTKVGVLALHEGLRNELLSRYENGFAIANTSVHPSWHATGIIKGFESKLAEHGIVADPPANVARAVVQQVLAHRSGQIYMPRSAESQAGTRRLPIWLQDIFLGNVQLNPFKTRKLTFD